MLDINFCNEEYIKYIFYIMYLHFYASILYPVKYGKMKFMKRELCRNGVFTHS